MTIETKYNIGDEVWITNNSQPIQVQILQITVKKRGEHITIEYMIDNDEVITRRYEQDLFPTKEELLKSL